MEKSEFASMMEDAKEQFGFYIKEEARRKFIGEAYPYLIRIPGVVFGITALLSTFAIFTLELIIAGVVLGEQPVLYRELLVGFGIALLIGIAVGKYVSSKASTKIHKHIGEVLKFKWYRKEENS